MPVNSADDWLHFLLGVGMVALGVLLTRRKSDPGAASPAPDGR